MNGPLGDPSVKTITSTNVENAFPLNLCLSDASTLARFNVWDGRKWRSDPTLTVSCTFFYWQNGCSFQVTACNILFEFEMQSKENYLPYSFHHIRMIKAGHHMLVRITNSQSYISKSLKFYDIFLRRKTQVLGKPLVCGLFGQNP